MPQSTSNEQRRDVESAVVGEIFESVDNKWREKYGEPNRWMRTIQFEGQFFEIVSYS